VTTTIDHITLRKVGTDLWQVWLPHWCSPDEPDDPDVPQEAWGTFYFDTWAEGLTFALEAAR
jgi:hypothetical protein